MERTNTVTVSERTKAAVAAEEKQMRFIVCSRNPGDGSVGLISQSAFPNRREAVEAIVESADLLDLVGSDVFLVDLDMATPVALVPMAETGTVAPLVPESGEAGPAEDSGDAAAPEALDAGDEVHLDDEGRLRLVEIDIEAWTCEDCIYVLTCDRSGTQRPAQCGSFQWRA